MIVLLVLVVIYPICILLHLASSAAEIATRVAFTCTKIIQRVYSILHVCVRLCGCGETDNSNMFIVCTSVCVCGLRG